VPIQAAKRQEVAEIVAALEAHNPTTNPTQHLDLVEGAWNLLYTTITITVCTNGMECAGILSGASNRNLGVTGFGGACSSSSSSSYINFICFQQSSAPLMAWMACSGCSICGVT
jgi:hypothetical protein